MYDNDYKNEDLSTNFLPYSLPHWLSLPRRGTHDIMMICFLEKKRDWISV